jgi:hypothetical protein
VGDEPAAVPGCADGSGSGRSVSIPASIRKIGPDRVFAPNADIAGNQTINLEYASQCNSAPGFPALTATRQTYAFKTGPSAPIESRAAELVVDERGVLYPGSPRNESAFVRLHYYPPDERGSATHLMDHAVSIDGRPLSYGSGSASDLIQLRSLCGETENRIDTCGQTWSYAPGKHVVKVATSVVGLDAQPQPVMVEVELSCGNASCTPTNDAGAATTSDAETAGASTQTTSEDRTSEASATTAGAARGDDRSESVDDASESVLEPTPQKKTRDGCSLSAPPLASSSGTTATVTLSALIATALRGRRTRT